MLRIKSFYYSIFNMAVAAILVIFIAACSSNDNNPTSPGGGNTAKVSGRISTGTGSPKMLSKSESIQAAAVTLAQVQTDGSLKTVSTQSVQTDASGKFVVETNLNGTKNLIVEANDGTTTWKAVVSAAVQSGTTVYAPPLSQESSTEADLYIKAVAEGHSSDVTDADVKALIDADASAQLHGDTNAQAQFISAVQAKSQAMAQASSNSYFGLSSGQMQTMMSAQTDACAKLDQDLYNSDDSDSQIETDHTNYENTVITTYASNNVNTATYAELMRIGLSAYTNASSSMSAQAKFVLAKCFYTRYSFVLSAAMNQQFQAAGASSSQLSAVSTAGTTLYASIKSSTSMSQISDAFVQYHSTIKSQLQITLNTYTTLIDSLDTNINASGSFKAVLTAALSAGISVDAIITAYVTFYNAVKTAAQTTLTGASSAQAQVSAASQIMILANMN